MADRRSKIINAIVNPAVMPGLFMIADTVTLTKGKVLTVNFPAKSVISVIASSSADTDAEKIVWTSAVSNETATVTFTATSAGASNKFSYMILASIVETIPANTITANTTETPVT